MEHLRFYPNVGENQLDPKKIGYDPSFSFFLPSFYMREERKGNI